MAFTMLLHFFTSLLVCGYRGTEKARSGVGSTAESQSQERISLNTSIKSGYLAGVQAEGSEEESSGVQAPGSALLETMKAFCNGKANNCCENHGAKWGEFGLKACNIDITQLCQFITEKGHHQGKELSGGASGNKPIRIADVIIKGLDATEFVQLARLMTSLDSMPIESSVLAPTCFLLDVSAFTSHDSQFPYVTVSANVGLQLEGLGLGNPDNMVDKMYDLKGNYEWRNRKKTDADGSFGLDGNFKEDFPHGLIVQPFSSDTMDLDGLKQSVAQCIDRLQNLQDFDYSALVHLRKLSAKPSDELKRRIANLNPGKPIFLALGAKSEPYLMTFGMIDLLYNEQDRKTHDRLAGQLLDCGPASADPLQPEDYATRFRRMFEGLERPCSNMNGMLKGTWLEGTPFTYFHSLKAL
eukprot:TRINITY_DN29093_c0_g1_i1.p1 TRINITY_DN29093_c0_g1~~TRINITY_DN29093_c0_g1_i1.p1  ORF type:complete len:412 (+),score=50.91 TRINITY_DN29093_c0_g1_i1:166-1401(+)